MKPAKANLSMTAEPGVWVRWFGTWRELQDAGLIPEGHAQPDSWSVSEWCDGAANWAAWRYRRPGVRLPADVIERRDYWLVQVNRSRGWRPSLRVIKGGKE